ncbi:hypothetical protein JCM5296_003168 [Sporobolomyces johnsonii]
MTPLPVPALKTLAFPPPLKPAAHSRIAYTREESLSPARAVEASSPGPRGRQYSSDSRGRRALSVGPPSSTSRGRSSEDWGSMSRSRERSSQEPGEADYFESERGRNESKDSRRAGSRAPLWRRRDESVSGVAEPPVHVSEKAPAGRTTTASWRVWGGKVARHFVGVRDDRSLPTPLLRPLRHLRPTHETYVLAFFGAFPAILVCCGISYGLSSVPGFEGDTPLAIGSLGATAVLLYALPEAPLSQPRNVVGGHMISALTGVIISQLFALSSKFQTPLSTDNTVAAPSSWHALVPVAGALAVAIAIFGQQITGTIHPPGGATALIASSHRTTVGRYTYLLDIFLAVVWMGVWSCFVNNLGRRHYPVYWWSPPPKEAVLPTTALPPPSASSTETSTLSPPASSEPPLKSPQPQPHPNNNPPPPKLSSPHNNNNPEEHEHVEFTPRVDLERRWLGRLGEVDEEAVAGDAENQEEEEEEQEEKRGRERRARSFTSSR